MTEPVTKIWFETEYDKGTSIFLSKDLALKFSKKLQARGVTITDWHETVPRTSLDGVDEMISEMLKPEDDEAEGFQRDLDSWHDEWESHEFGCK